MIVFGALLVNIFVTLFFFIRSPKEYKWWEFIISISITTLLVFGSKALVESANARFTEYWNETISEVFEEEPYNWWKTETCSRQVACGTDKDGNTEYCTEYYDCSHQEDEGPSWWCETTSGKTYSLSEKYYDKLNALYGNNRIITKTRKNYAPRDKAVGSNGTKFEGTRVGPNSYIYKTNWPKTEETRKGVYTEHSYINKVKASDLSVFNIDVITKEDADSLGLFQYPDKIDRYFCPTILGGNISEGTQDKFRRLNAKYGPSNQLRLWILIFEDKPSSYGPYQENYWVKGNKNELVICIGINKNKEITWTYAFSWALSSILTAEVKNKVWDLYEYTIISKDGQKLPIALPIVPHGKQLIHDATGLDTSLIPPILPLPIGNDKIQEVKKSKTPLLNERTLDEYYRYLDANLNKFERRPFEEFSYLKADPKGWQIIMIYIIALIVSLGLNLWLRSNEYHDHENHGSSSYYKKNRYHGYYR